jgi:cation:H+ antiporter
MVGLAALLIGGRGLVDAATEIARFYHVPEEVIGATMLAIGTSLPELASTLAAAVRGLGDIAIGNVVGSNVFNLTFVLGISALVGDLQLTQSTVIRQVVPALIFCVVLIPLAYSGGRVNRWEGALLLSGYAGFIFWVLQAAYPSMVALY